jgi:methyl-accepting chemotaxis protein
MNRTTQQNAANAEESASAAEQLSSQAEELRSLVKQYNLSERTQISNHSSKSLNVTAERPKTKNAQLPLTKAKQFLPMDDNDDDFDDFSDFK